MSFIDNLTEPFYLCISSSRKSGKTFLIKKYLADKDFQAFFSYIYVFSPTSEFNYEYNDTKHTKIFQDVSEYKQLINDIIKQQKDVIKMYGKQRAPHILLVLDDCIGEGLFKYNSICESLATRGRHIKISVIISTQKITSISPVIRNNADGFIIFSPTNFLEIERWIEEFLPRSFRKQFQKKLVSGIFNKPYTYLFVDNTIKDINKRFLIDGKEPIDLFNLE